MIVVCCWLFVDVGCWLLVLLVLLLCVGVAYTFNGGACKSRHA